MVIVLPIFAAGEKKIRGINASNLAKIIKKNSKTKTLHLDQFEKVDEWKFIIKANIVWSDFHKGEVLFNIN